MWNKRREDEPTQRPPSPQPAQADINREAAPAASPAARSTSPEPPRGVAAIGKSVIIKGQILSREDLYLDGEIEGTVEVPEHRLTIGPHAKLQAGIRAREVVVLGTVNGNVESSDKIDIRKDARLVGDIKTGGIVIEDGAYFKGSIDIVRQAEAKHAPAAKPQQQPAPATTVPVGAGSDQRK
jgi:cytoskeletal protein CcmA (bactofilin family)